MTRLFLGGNDVVDVVHCERRNDGVKALEMRVLGRAGWSGIEVIF